MRAATRTYSIDPSRIDTLLADLELFAGLDAEELDSLAHRLELTRARPGQTLETQDVPVRQWSLIVEGHAVVARDGTPLGLLGRGQSWNEHSMLHQQRCAISVVALSPVTLLSLDQERFFAIPEQHPVLAGRLVARSATSPDRLAQPAFNALVHMERRRGGERSPNWEPVRLGARQAPGRLFRS
jgi:CRP-like cAMP-binding protein